MRPLTQERLVNEATRCDTGEVLRRTPAWYSPRLEWAPRQALFCYVANLESVSRQGQPAERQEVRA